MSTETKTKALTPIDEVRGAFAKMSDQFKMALPAQVTPEKFIRVVMTAIQNDQKLLNADRRSLYGAAMKSAQDGLLPDGREAAFVIFGDQVSYMPMVGGILKKVRNSGELASLSANVVYEHDEFSYWVDEVGEHLKHVPNLSGKRGEVRLVYAVARTKDGVPYIEVMDKEAIEQVRNVSRAKAGGPWKDWYGEMARKTVIRRLSKRLPMSTDLDQVIRADDEVFDVKGEATTAAVEEAPKKASRLGKIIDATAEKTTPESGDVKEADLVGKEEAPI